MPRPPGWIDKVLNWLLPSHYSEEVAGDLHEAFYWRLETRGQGFANRMFLWEVIRASRFYLLKTQNNSSIMLFTNYFKTGLRFLLKTKTYSLINILGLAIGIAVAWMSVVYVVDEWSYDNHFSKVDRMYRIVAEFQYQGTDYIGGASYIMAEEYGKQIPAIESITRYKPWYLLLETGEGTVPFISHRVDKGIFDILDFTFIEGNSSAFTRPDVAVISKSAYDRISQSGEDVNELTIYTYSGEERRFQVVGVYKDLPSNSSVHPEVLFPIENYAKDNPDRLGTWFDINMNVLLTLRERSDPIEVGHLMTEILYQNEEFENAEVAMMVQPFSEIHTDEQIETGNGVLPRANTELVYLVLAIGLFCLVIAIINYGNFAINNYLIRLKEVGIRKIFGANRSKVFHQLTVETLISTVLATFVSLVLISFLAPIFSEYANKEYQLTDFFNASYLLIGLGILLLTTILTAFYPTIILSRQKIVGALKGRIVSGGKGLIGRTLMAFQFSLAVFLIIGMLVFGRQLELLVNFDKGLDMENVLQVGIPNPDNELLDRIKNELLTIPGIEKVTRVTGNNGTNYSDEDVEFLTAHNRIDEDYIPMMGIELVAGRNFDASRQTDITNAIIVNETFVKKAGLDDPVDQSVPFNYGDLDNPTIIGVVKDYYFENLKTQMEPLVLYISPQYAYGDFLIKASSDHYDFITEVEEIWMGAFSPFPFNYTSMNEVNRYQYELESQIRDLTNAGSLIAIFLACLGLMGIVGTNVRQRLKEVCIRKVNGASPSTILGIFLQRYVLFTALGFLIGLVTSFYILEDWLNQYIVRIELGWGISLIALGMVVIVALITIFSQLYKAMYLNPIHYLRDE